eukprot:3850395-Rhodomonas_salina.1
MREDTPVHVYQGTRVLLIILFNTGCRSFSQYFNTVGRSRKGVKGLVREKRFDGGGKEGRNSYAGPGHFGAVLVLLRSGKKGPTERGDMCGTR